MWPIQINNLLENPCLEHPLGLPAGEVHRFRQIDQLMDFADVFAIYEIGSKEGIMKFIAFTLWLRPLTQFLSQAAIISFFPLS
jgi:hypothetical protein